MTDTFGTPAFLDAFSKPIPEYTSAGVGAVSTSASGAGTTTQSNIQSEAQTTPPIAAPIHEGGEHKKKTYADVYTGVRQDSGDPSYFVKMVRDFYDGHGITGQKVIVFSDSLNIENCLEYKVIAEEANFKPVFGVGTFFTSKPSHSNRFHISNGELISYLDDFINKANDEKSKPLNIVIKIATASGRPAVKLSDNMGKNTGDKDTVQQVKRKLGYVEHTWEQGNEANRWADKS